MFEGTTDANDPVLRPLVAAGSETGRQEVIADLLSAYAYDRIDRILASRFAQSRLDRHHREDVRNEILVRLVDRLHGLSTHSSAIPIASFPDYVSVVAFNTFDEFVRRASPERAKLRNRIRYALRHDARLALWETGGATLCGLSEWRGSADAAQLQHAPRAIRNRGALPVLVRAIFDEIGKAIALEDLVSLVADVRGITDRGAEAPPGRELAAPDRDPFDRVSNLQYLHKLWDEICDLPLRQRIALLLNARDAAGESVVRFLPLVGIASIRQIGSTLSIEAADLADLWPELPLEDTRIALILQVTRQQVINLRRTARERLQRRMRGHGARES